MMKPAHLRAWIRKYGDWGYLLAGLYLCIHSCRQDRRASFTACAASIALVISGLWWWQAKPKQIAGHQLHLGTNERQAIRLSSGKSAARAHAQPDRVSKDFKPTIRLTKDGPDEVKLTGLDGKLVVWRAELGNGGYPCFEACVFPKDRMVVYFEKDRGLIARRFDGTTVWNLPLVLRAARIELAGGNFILVSDFGPTPGVTSPPAEIASCFGRCLINACTGSVVWKSDESYVGDPCWMNDKVFIDVREDFNHITPSPDGISVGEEPRWIELRRVRDHSLIWRRRFKGNTSREPLQRVNARQLKFYYYPSSEDDTERPHPGSKRILVPVRRRRAEAQEQAPILYTVPSNY